MRLTIDTTARTLQQELDGGQRSLSLDSAEAFELLSAEWLKLGWSQQYYTTFSWLGLPILQVPEDLVRVQEVVYRLKPDVIVETGVWHGGSLLFYASLCRLIGHGRVIGVDLVIQPETRKAVEAHPLASLVRLVEGDSTAPTTVAAVKAQIAPGETVLVILDSAHTKQHVANEFECYHALVSPGSYIVATDGVMEALHDVPGGQPGWRWDNPSAAAREFAARHPEFVAEQPAWAYNDSDLSRNITYWPEGWLRRKTPSER